MNRAPTSHPVGANLVFVLLLPVRLPALTRAV